MRPCLPRWHSNTECKSWRSIIYWSSIHRVIVCDWRNSTNTTCPLRVQKFTTCPKGTTCGRPRWAIFTACQLLYDYEVTLPHREEKIKAVRRVWDCYQFSIQTVFCWKKDRTKKEKQAKTCQRKLRKAKVQQPKRKKSKKTKNVSTDIVEDSQCPMCDGFWSDSLAGEDWVQCSECKNWLHGVLLLCNTSKCNMWPLSMNF